MEVMAEVIVEVIVKVIGRGDGGGLWAPSMFKLKEHVGVRKAHMKMMPASLCPEPCDQLETRWVLEASQG